MGNVYTSQTIANYNQNPPADDGSEVPSNQVTWAKHKTKLTDPIKTLSEAINTQLSTAFGKVQGGITAVSDDYTVLAGDQGKLIVQSGTGKTITTPAAATVGAPFRFGVVNIHASGNLTLDGNSSETIDGSATITIPAGRGLIVETDGTNWYTHGQNWPTSVLIDLLGISFSAGDLIYHDGSNLVNLGIGSALQELRTNAGATAPEWFSPTSRAWTKISDTTYSSIVASHDETDLSGYSMLRIMIENFVPATDAVGLYLRTDSDNGASFDAGVSDYDWRIHGGTNGSNSTGNGDAADGAIHLWPSAIFTQLGNAANEAVSGEILLFGFNQAAYMQGRWHLTGVDDTGDISVLQGAGRRLSTTARDAFRILFSSGNIASGRVVVEGMA